MAASRTTHQGAPNLVRNRGTMGSIFDMEDNVSSGYLSARPGPRGSEDAQRYLRTQLKGNMEKYLNLESDADQVDAGPPKSTKRHEENYSKNQGTVGKWLNVEENLASGYQSARPAPRACPSEEAKLMKEKSKGILSDCLGPGSDYKPGPTIRKIHPRGLSEEAAPNAEVHKGKRMDMIIHGADNKPESPKLGGRTIKPEAEYIADKHNGRSVANLITNYGYLPVSERAPRVTVWGEDNMMLNNGGRIKQLMGEPQRINSFTPSSSTRDRVPSARAANYNKRNATQWDQAWT